jgi:hypothetical protein
VLLSPLVRSVAIDTIRWLRNAPLDQPRKGAQREGGVGPTKELELEAAGIFEAFADGVRMRVTSRSIARRRIALAILSHPVDGPKSKVRQPKARFQKKIRPRTENELRALQRANDARREDAARKRREESRA